MYHRPLTNTSSLKIAAAYYPMLCPEQTLIFIYELQVAGHVIDVILVEAHDAVPRLGVCQATQRSILNRHLCTGAFFYVR